MSLKERYNLEYLENESERLVLEQLESQLDGLDDAEVCQCQDCVLDMAALALNNVKPLYRVSLLGALYTRAVDSTDFIEEVKRVVAESIRKIAANPSH